MIIPRSEFFNKKNDISCDIINIMKKSPIVIYLIIISLTIASFVISFSYTREILTKENFFGPILLIFLLPFYYFFFVLTYGLINLFKKSSISKTVERIIVYFVIILLIFNMIDLLAIFRSPQSVKIYEIIISIILFPILCFIIFYIIYNKKYKLFIEQNKDSSLKIINSNEVVKEEYKFFPEQNILRK